MLISMQNIRYPMQPIVFDADVMHKSRSILYQSDGSAQISHPMFNNFNLSTTFIIPPEKQAFLVHTTMHDLYRRLSKPPKSPILCKGQALYQHFELEMSRYLKANECPISNSFGAIDYGKYVFDHVEQELYLLAPPYWHRIALTLSTGSLLKIPESNLTWEQTRNRLESMIVGVIGCSVGSNIIEGIARELRPQQIKLADPDWIEVQNLNRLERVSLRQVCKIKNESASQKRSRSQRNKAEITAYLQNLVDPFMEFFVYKKGIDTQNLDQFLLGDNLEPKVDVIIEEADDLPTKIQVRKRCRELGIPVLMLTDAGNQVLVHFQDFSLPEGQSMPIAYACSDEKLDLLIACANKGTQEDFRKLLEGFLGADCLRGSFLDWCRNKGEQPTLAIPQSGATALISGGIAAKLLTLHRLGRRLPKRLIYDFYSQQVDATASI